jgi:hypothetical protein
MYKPGEDYILFLNKKVISKEINISNIQFFFNETEYSQYHTPDLFNIYLNIYKQNYMSHLLKIPTMFRTMNIQDIIHKELLAYMMYSARSIK